MLDTWLDPDGRFLGAACPLPLDTPFDVHVAREQGVSPRTLTDLERRGLLRRELRGVYVAAQVPHDMRTRVEALRWVVSDDQVVCDRTAAWLWGVAALPRSARWVPPALDVCSVVETTRARRVGVTGTRRGLMPTDIELVDGLAVTTPARTALDLGRLLRPLEAIAALDGFRGLGVPLDVLRLEVARFRGYRGVVQLRRLVPLSDSRSQSPGESALRLCWHDAGLPPPEPQHEVPHDQGSSYFIDVADGPTRFGAEYDGEDHHTSAEDRAHDDERRGWLRAQAAWTIEVFTKHDVYPRDADPVARLARAYAVHRRDTQLWTPGWRPSTAVVSTARSASWG